MAFEKPASPQGPQGPGGPPMVPGARKAAIEPGVIARVTAGIRDWMSRGAAAQRQLQRIEPTVLGGPSMEGEILPPGMAERPNAPSMVTRSLDEPGSVQDGWFGPGQPQLPQAPREEVAGRQFDFASGFNLTTQPRRYEPVSFQLLRDLASGYDLLRLAIETRKEQIAKVRWHILPKKPPGQRHNMKADDTCIMLEKFFERPDGVNDWPQWVRGLAEDCMVLDATALYRRRTRGGKPFALEQVDGASINLLIDRTGRRPLPPRPAFQQVLKGIVAAEFTSEEMTYSIRNPRSNKVYGYGPVEQIINYVNIGLRRMAGQMNHFTEGNIPEAMMSVPEGWSVAQIAEYQRYWDNLMENAANRRRMKFVAPGMNYWPVHGESGASLMDAFDEWLARIVCYAFSLPPLPFVKMQNRATAETAYETALEEGLEPMLTWLKGVIDREIEGFMGCPGYEIVWDDIRKIDPAEQHGMDHADMRVGLKSLDEIRTGRGDEPLGVGHIVWGVGPLGFMSIGALKKSIELGLDMPPDPAAMDTMGMLGAPGGGDPLAGADPALLSALGIPSGGGAPGQAAPPAPPADEAGEEGDEEGAAGQTFSSPPIAQRAPRPRLPPGRMQQLRQRYQIGGGKPA